MIFPQSPGESYDSDSEEEETPANKVDEDGDDSEPEPEVYIEGTDDRLHFNQRLSGFCFCDPDSDGNVFVVVLGDKSGAFLFEKRKRNTLTNDVGYPEDPSEYTSNTTRTYLYDGNRKVMYFGTKESCLYKRDIH